jgi:hypothetical protein
MPQLDMKKRTWRSVLRLPFFPEPKERVAIVVPLSSRPALSDAERISLRHLQHYLPGFDTYFIVPPNNTAELPPDANTIEFPARYFGSNVAHSRLQLSPEFYEQFLDYQYILIYHLDALVFSEALLPWCDRGLDYIGAPWFKTEHTPWVTEPEVGNSGFTLMNIRSFLRTLYSRRRWTTVKQAIAKAKQDNRTGLAQALATVWAFRRILPFRNNVRSHIETMMDKEQLSDLFWSRHAKHYNPSFRVATVQEALPFAFEVDPAGCYEKTHHELPFGCHAWEKFDRAFWQPYLLTNESDQVAVEAHQTNTSMQPR